MRFAAALALVWIAIPLAGQQDPAVAAQDALAKCERAYMACARSCAGAACGTCEVIRSACRSAVYATVTITPKPPGGSSPSNPGSGGTPQTPPGLPPLPSKCGAGGDGQACAGDGVPCTYDVCKNGQCVSQQPAVQTTLSSNIFYITAEPSMPPIVASAKVTGVEPDPTATAQFRWTFTITYTAPFGKTVKVDLPAVVAAATYQPQFTSIRGGTLTARATLVREGGECGGGAMQAEIRATNPTFAEVKAALGNDPVLARIACHESQRKLQFSKGKPLIEGGGGKGVGIMQLTNPPPSEDAFWNWRTNVKEGMNIYASKKKAAESYYKSLSKLKPPAPALTEEQKRQDLMTRYNGGSYWKYVNGKWVASPPLHPLKLCKGKRSGDRVTINAKKGTWDICRSYYERVMREKSCD